MQKSIKTENRERVKPKKPAAAVAPTQLKNVRTC